MKHISDNIKMNTLLLVLKEKYKGNETFETQKSQNLEWITRHVIETLIASGLAIVITMVSTTIAIVVNDESKNYQLLVIIAGLICAVIVLFINRHRVIKDISLTVENGKLKDLPTESGVLNLEKYIFPKLVVAEECFETVEQNTGDGNCNELNVIWGEISLKRAINCLDLSSGSFKREYEEDGICGGLSKYEIDKLFAVFCKVISLRGDLKNYEKLNNTEKQTDAFIVELIEMLNDASIKIRGIKL